MIELIEMICEKCGIIHMEDKDKFVVYAFLQNEYGKVIGEAISEVEALKTAVSRLTNQYTDLRDKLKEIGVELDIHGTPFKYK